MNVSSNIFPLKVDENTNYKLDTLTVRLENVFISEDLILDNKFNFDFLNCKLCYSVIRDPVSCNQCEDLFCSFCIDICLDKKNRCPHCRDIPFNERKINKNINNILNDIAIKCPLLCGEVFKYKNLHNHLEICSSRPKLYTCNYCCVGIRVENNDLVNLISHNEECPNIKFKCPECKNIFTRENIYEHIKKCEENFFTCDICTLRIPKKFSVPHKEFYCKLIFELNQKFAYFFEKV